MNFFAHRIRVDYKRVRRVIGGEAVTLLLLQRVHAPRKPLKPELTGSGILVGIHAIATVVGQRMRIVIARHSNHGSRFSIPSLSLGQRPTRTSKQRIIVGCGRTVITGIFLIPNHNAVLAIVWNLIVCRKIRFVRHNLSIANHNRVCRIRKHISGRCLGFLQRVFAVIQADAELANAGIQVRLRRDRFLIGDRLREVCCNTVRFAALQHRAVHVGVDIASRNRGNIAIADGGNRCCQLSFINGHRLNVAARSITTTRTTIVVPVTAAEMESNLDFLAIRIRNLV